MERTIRIPEAADLVGVGKSTIFRWIHSGFRGVRLGAERRGMTWFTSQRDIDEFTRTVTDASLAKPAEQVSENDPTFRAAERALDKLGI